MYCPLHECPILELNQRLSNDSSLTIFLQKTTVLSHKWFYYLKPYECRKGDNRPGDGLGGLRPTDLVAVRCWTRLRTCHLTIDVDGDDLASPPSRRKFIQLNNADLVPRLVKQWKEELKMLEIMDVSCRVVVDDEYVQQMYNDRSTHQVCRTKCVYPLIFASKCDCGQVHFCIDAEDDSAKCFGFLKADEWRSAYRHWIGHTGIFSRVLRDTTPRFVRPSVGRSPFYFFYVFAVFGLTALAQVL